MSARRKRHPEPDVIARYGNRVVRTGTVKAGTLLANPGNWRIHPGAQQEALGAVLEQVGFVQAVLVNLRRHPDWGESRFVETLVDGHLRVQLALSRDEDTELPVTYVDLSPGEEAAVLATFDPLSAMAVTDREKLDELLATVPSELEGLTALLRTDERPKKTVSFEAKDSHDIVVSCESATQRETLIARLTQEGYRCR